MVDMLDTLEKVGLLSIFLFWVPVLVWTVVSSTLFFLGRRIQVLRASTRHLMSVALLAALPAGLLISPLISHVGFRVAGADAVGSLVIEDPTVAPRGAPSYGEPLLGNKRLPAGLLESLPGSGGESSIESGRLSTGGILTGVLTLGVLLAGLFGLFRLVWAVSMLSRLKSDFKSVIDPRVFTEFNSIRNNLGIDREVRLLSGPEHMAPMTYGWRKPSVVIPSSLIKEGCDNNDRRLSLIHELVHVRRNDFLIASVTRTITAIMHWHPLVHALRRDADLQREIACDDDLLTGHFRDTPGYARTLLRFSKMSQLVPALSIRGTKSTLARRIEAMNNSMKYGRQHASRSTAGMLVLLFLLIPGVFTACVGIGDESAKTEAVNDQLFRMEAEVAYLDSQLAGVYEELSTIPDGPPSREIQFRMEPVMRRKQLLEGMRLDRSEGLENMRMKVAVDRIMSTR